MAEKLSEAVEKVGYDILPEAKPEDFEVTTVAAVSEPFADAKVRNKAAREKFKKMIDTQTKQAKETLKLDDQLKERQVNGNGKLVEKVHSNQEVKDAVKKAFDESYQNVYNYIYEDLAAKLEENGVYNEPAFYYVPTTIKSGLKSLYDDIQADYLKDYIGIKINENNNQPKPKISLDEGLFETVITPTNIKESTDSKKLTEAKIIADVREYKPWQGAVTTYEKIQEADKLDNFYDLLDEVYPAGIDVQALNDLLWFEADWIYEMLGMEVEQ